MNAYAYCEDRVRAADKDRFLASLFAPAEARRHLFALYAFNAEIARVREVVRTPMAGEIRLQWWRDALQGEGHGEVRANPVADALIGTMAACRLPVEPLLALIEARSFDLYNDPMPTLDALYGYVRKTSSSLVELAAVILGGADPIAAGLAGPAGIGSGIARLLQAFPVHAAGGRLYLPGEVLARHGVAPADVYARRATPQLRAALSDLRERARLELDQVATAADRLTDQVRPAFLTVALARLLLDRLEAHAADPFAPVEVPQWRRQWALWRSARRLR
ncbi:MAG: squalene/phytoene synthase family protein [Bradyrhizobiaceae bacterium]|nr:squalene/phytoene synthase family protein [Bradyrhizobiaceae bacterium]